MNTILVEHNLATDRIYAVAQIEGHSDLFYIEIPSDKAGLRSLEFWCMSMKAYYDERQEKKAA